MKSVCHTVIAILLVVGGLGCSSVKLQPDPVVLSSIEANYPSLEFSACGKNWNGLGVCQVTDGSPLALLNLKVQGYFNGVIKVDSKRCGIDTSITYVNNQQILIPLKGNATSDCIVTMTLEPSYPVKEPEMKIENFRGSLAIRIQKKLRPWVSDVKKLTGQWESNFDVALNSPDIPARIFAAGCGKTYDHKYMPTELWVEFALNEAVALQGAQTCVLDGFVQQGSYVAQFDVFIAQFQPLFTQLPTPIIELDGSTLYVTGDEAVSVIGLDGDNQIANPAKFKGFNPAINHILRLLTVQGRLVIGEWPLSDRSWHWKQ